MTRVAGLLWPPHVTASAKRVEVWSVRLALAATMLVQALGPGRPRPGFRQSKAA